MTHRVVVVGGGFGGMAACRFLGHVRGVDVTLVDRRNHHLFQPLLYQVATGVLAAGQIAPPLRHVMRKFPNVRVELAEVTSFDLDRRVVHAVRVPGVAIEVPYDSLVVAAGAGQSYFGHDEFALAAPGMKTIDDALELRRRIFGAFELAELATDPQEQREWLTVVVVGAGPTGVELAGQVRELAVRLRHEYRAFDSASVRVLLVDGGKEPLASFGNRLSNAAARELAAIGVELRMGSRVTGVDTTGVVVETANGTDRIAARTTIWAAGVAASPLAKMLGDATGAEVDRAGRVATNPDLTLPGHPEVFAIGDMVTLRELPGVAEVALQGGLHAANTIRRRLHGHEHAADFRYRDLGSVATIGRLRAVCSFWRFRLSGAPAWFVWMFVHLAFLNGFGSRFSTMWRWVTSLIGPERPERVFSVAHTGGDLSAPEQVRALFSRTPFPEMTPQPARPES
ncbi:MAG TPA: NAD(P)/FAD-dependent oxidoreductase [Acidimicrobiia bacterium]|nr:NAD(P)/FAD-dependent oxidoreductase [Acidimicrobiia bacterium]